MHDLTLGQPLGHLPCEVGRSLGEHEGCHKAAPFSTRMRCPSIENGALVTESSALVGPAPLDVYQLQRLKTLERGLRCSRRHLRRVGELGDPPPLDVSQQHLLNGDTDLAVKAWLSHRLERSAARPVAVYGDERRVATKHEPAVVKEVDSLAMQELERAGREVLCDQGGRGSRLIVFSNPHESIAHFVRPAVAGADRAHGKFSVRERDANMIRMSLREHKASLAERRFELSCLILLHYGYSAYVGYS